MDDESHVADIDPGCQAAGRDDLVDDACAATSSNVSIDVIGLILQDT